jgi:hypothetical protein
MHPRETQYRQVESDPVESLLEVAAKRLLVRGRKPGQVGKGHTASKREEHRQQLHDDLPLRGCGHKLARQFHVREDEREHHASLHRGRGVGRSGWVVPPDLRSRVLRCKNRSRRPNRFFARLLGESARSIDQGKKAHHRPEAQGLHGHGRPGSALRSGSPHCFLACPTRQTEASAERPSLRPHAEHGSEPGGESKTKRVG